MPLRRAVILAFTAILTLLSVLSVQVQAQTSGPCDDAYLKSLPLPTVNNDRVVQIINCTDQVLLGATNAGHRIKEPPYPAFPDEKTWVMQPFNPNNWADHSNILTIQIPTQWEATVGTKKDGANAPNIWARTGCHYDIKNNRAVCETGGCGDQYDCSAANLGPSDFTTITEWTFYQKTGVTFIDNPDISAVNGASLTVDVQAANGDDRNPNGLDWGWLRYNGHLANYGQDVRNPTYCGSTSVTDGGFLLKRSDINKTNYLKYEIIDEDANLACLKNQDPDQCAKQKTDNSLACLSNCGYYEFPQAQTPGCDQNDPKCVGWEVFCAGDPNLFHPPNQKELPCVTDKFCTDYAKEHGAGPNGVYSVCWYNDPNSSQGFCAQRAFYKEDISNCDTQMTDDKKNYWGAPTGGIPGQDWVIPCSYPYQSYNDLTKMIDWSTQPANGMCSDVKVNGQSIACVGDDSLHKVLYGAYTWPNDPEVFGGNAHVYRVIYSPQSASGINLPITPSVAEFPLCSDMPDNYKPTENATSCNIAVEYEGAIFAAAVANKNADGKYISTGSDWPCSLFQSSAAVSSGATCRWHPAGPLNCDPPVLDADVTQSACAKIDSGTSLVSSQITPIKGEPLFVQVSVPKVLNSVQASSLPTGCADSWQPVAGGLLTLFTDEGYLAWYQATANTDLACTVSVTLTQSNPAELKVYGIPGFNGTIATTSSASGKFDLKTAAAAFPYSVTAGSVTLDPNQQYLMLGSLLLVNHQFAPLTRWNNWLSNALIYPGVDCDDLNGQPNDKFCPTDDGTDFLPGYGNYSANSDAGHAHLKGYSTYVVQRAGFPVGPYSWGGVALYLQVNTGRGVKLAQKGAETRHAVQ
jgi:hypothetical protein